MSSQKWELTTLTEDVETDIAELSRVGIFNPDGTLQFGSYNCVVMGYERLSNRLEAVVNTFNWPRTLVIVDETSRIKSPTARRSKASRYICNIARYVALLTGTPMEQGPQDLWMQYACIDNGASLGIDFSAFEATFLRHVGVNKYAVQQWKQLEFELAIQKIGLRYTRGEADQFSGKDKGFHWTVLAPSLEQHQATADLIDGVVRMMSDELIPLTEKQMQLIVQMGYLREICCGWNKIRLIEGGPYARFRFSYDPKTLWIQAFLLGNPGVPAIIFTEFDEHEQIITEMLDREKIPYVWVKRDVKRLGSRELVRRFQEGDVRCIVMKTDQAEGITLNRVPAVQAGIGSYPAIIYAAPTWKLGRFLQSQDRAVGVDPTTKKNICTPIYVLQVNGGIEGKIINALKRKGNVQEVLLKDLDRKGYQSFVDELRLDMTMTDSVFDTEDIAARIELGIGPERRPTHKLIRSIVTDIDSYDESLVPDLTQLNGAAYTRAVRYLAARYLLKKYNEKGYRR